MKKHLRNIKNQLLSSLILKKANKLVLLFCTILMVGACDNTSVRTDSILLEDLSPKELIDSFYHYKKRYLLGEEEHFATLQEKWNAIVLNRDSVLSFLLCSNFKTDSSTSLYGTNYPEVKSDKEIVSMMVPNRSQYPVMIPENYMIEKSPNYIHALYLVEAIIQNDYLFNRRYHADFLTSPKEFLYHDGLNFIYSRDSLPYVNVESKISYVYSKKDIRFIWRCYSSWFNKYALHKQLGFSPLKTTTYRWYNRNRSLLGASVSSAMIYSENQDLIKKYRLDYKIGNGWMSSEIRN